MAAQSIVRVIGAKELRAGLKRAGHDLSDFKETNLKVAGIVAGAARQVAPVGKTHRLQGSIRPGATLRAAIVRVGKASIPYPAVDHYGNRAHNIKPNPWLVNVAHAEEPNFLPVYEDFISSLVDKI